MKFINDNVDYYDSDGELSKQNIELFYQKLKEFLYEQILM